MYVGGISSMYNLSDEYYYLHAITIISSRVYGSVTNNNGFWIGWLNLLTVSFTITRNHNQLQEITINLQPYPSSLTAEDSPHSRSRSRSLSLNSDLSRFYTTLIVSRWTHGIHIRCLAMNICEPHRTHLFPCQECVFISPPPSNVTI
jgi:hypothetical protein